MKLVHTCSSHSLLSILKSKRFVPKYDSPLAGDSGINCFIADRKYNTSQCFGGAGAFLYFDWQSTVTEVSIDAPFPLTPDVLHNQESWRAVIPRGTKSSLIKVVDFEIKDNELNFWDNIQIKYFKYKLKKNPMFINL
ncbi:hypothetical protein [Colwellia sp. Bg11-12]|uniref:hypothetical protein n=1 Tax=Colwellia sp. Bg11-12 TaxID=2759817 RepID=UPI0015F5D422|nr:hypothetical protein [Colwellia sp. Bg11-12]MBA6262129.1 hypothetical protein [Colwellia sp. Bg11-12]